MPPSPGKMSKYATLNHDRTSVEMKCVLVSNKVMSVRRKCETAAFTG